jgi:hypothetical protein
MTWVVAGSIHSNRRQFATACASNKTCVTGNRPTRTTLAAATENPESPSVSAIPSLRAMAAVTSKILKRKTELHAAEKFLFEDLPCLDPDFDSLAEPACDSEVSSRANPPARRASLGDDGDDGRAVESNRWPIQRTGFPPDSEMAGGRMGRVKVPLGLRENPGQKTFAQGRPVAVRQAGSGARDWKG